MKVKEKERKKNYISEIVSGGLFYLFYLKMLFDSFMDGKTPEIPEGINGAAEIISDGVHRFFNCFSMWLTGKYGRIYPLFERVGEEEQAGTLFIVLVLCSALLFLLLLFCFTEKKPFFCLLLFPFLLLPFPLLNMKMETNHFFVCLFCAFLFPVQKGKESRREWMEEAVLFLLLFLGACFLTERLFDVQGSSKPCSVPLLNGNLRAAGDYAPTESILLEVRMERPESFYLKGFVGAEYEDSRWKKEDGEVLCKYRDLFYWLHEEGFYGQSQLSDAAMLLTDAGKESRITIKHRKGCAPYSYVPYELSKGSTSILDEKGIGDRGTLLQSETAEYSYSVIGNQVKSYPALAYELYRAEKNAQEKDGVSLYSEQERHYNAYVYEAYTVIPDAHREFFKTVFPEMEAGKEHLSYMRAKQEVLSYLTSQMSYDTTVSVPDQGEDFLLHFLTGAKRGYSVHFATAATELFRYFGIPARYAEGYLITPEVKAHTAPGGTVFLTEEDAHAWCEIYQDGIGWVPFEVTPPYLNRMESAENLTAAGSAGMSFANREEAENRESVTESSSFTKFRIRSVCSALFVLVFLLLCRIAIQKIRRRMALKRALFCEDKREALQNRFSYAMTHLFSVGLIRRNVSLKEYQDDITKKWGTEYGILFQEAVKCHETIRFGEKIPGRKEEEVIDTFFAKTMKIKRGFLLTK